MVTDGTISYAIFTYNCNAMQWSGQQESQYAAVGINSDDLLYNHIASHSPNVHRDVSCSNLPREPWANEVFVIGRSSSPVDIAVQQCLMRIDEDKTANPFLEQDISFGVFRFFAPCPCSIFQAVVDFRYFFFSQIDSRVCFATFTQPAQICCYSISRVSL